MKYYISDLEYLGNNYNYIINFNENVKITVREIGTDKIVSKYNFNELYGFTDVGVFVTHPMYFKLYDTIKFSHEEQISGINVGGAAILYGVDADKTLFRSGLANSSFLHGCKTLGDILCDTDWYYIKDDLLYVRQIPSFKSIIVKNLVYKILDRKRFDLILTKLKVLKR